MYPMNLLQSLLRLNQIEVKPCKLFDTLDAAVDYINSGMKSKESETFILYNESDDEMIWIDR